MHVLLSSVVVTVSSTPTYCFHIFQTPSLLLSHCCAPHGVQVHRKRIDELYSQLLLVLQLGRHARTGDDAADVALAASADLEVSLLQVLAPASMEGCMSKGAPAVTPAKRHFPCGQAEVGRGRCMLLPLCACPSVLLLLQ